MEPCRGSGAPGLAAQRHNLGLDRFPGSEHNWPIGNYREASQDSLRKLDQTACKRQTTTQRLAKIGARRAAWLIPNTDFISHGLIHDTSTYGIGKPRRFGDSRYFGDSDLLACFGVLEESHLKELITLVEAKRKARKSTERFLDESAAQQAQLSEHDLALFGLGTDLGED